ncbi:MAG: alpha/beta fold hydrolase [Archangium sp.]|nr:alpha/beta fold hydrolase [Archangium sp.]
MRSSREALSTSMMLEERRACVLVLLPGLGDSPERFTEHGFAEAAGQSSAPCDVLALDSHFGYYRDGVLVERVVEEVLLPLRGRYQRLWLVGVSLGGYGAALIADARPELVDGVVLISPFLGVPREVRPFIERIEAAGGLSKYPGPFASRGHPRRHFMEVEPLWSWLAGRARGEAGPRLVIAWGAADGFSWKHRVVGAGLDPQDVVQLEGGHTWETFAALWREVAAACPWKG